mgnify:CR=1 FL=1
MALKIIIDPSTDTTFYDSVRRLLGGLTEEDLPNEHISDPVIFDLTETEILSLVPCLTEEEVDDSIKQKARLAMIYLLAARLCQSVQGMVEYEVRTIDVSWKKKPLDYEALQADLRGTAQTLLESIECYTGTEDSAILVVAPSKRVVNMREEL